MDNLKGSGWMFRAVVLGAFTVFATSTAFAAEQSEEFKKLAEQRKAELQAIASDTAKAVTSAGSRVKAPGAKAAVIPAPAADRKLIGKEGTRTVGGKTVVTTDPHAMTEGGIPTKEKIRSGEVTGGVLQVRGGTNGQIGVAQEKSDVYFLLDPKVRLENVAKLSEIKRGDVVKVRYEERYLEDDKSLYNKRVVKEIIFLKKKPPEPVDTAPVAEEDDEP